MQLRRVRAFINYHFDILQDPPVSLAHTVMQLAELVAVVLFWQDHAKMAGPEASYQPIIIERLNKPQHTAAARLCLLTLQMGDKVGVVAYSPDGAKLTRAQGVVVVVCDPATVTIIAVAN